MRAWPLRLLSLSVVLGSVTAIGFFTALPARSQLGVAKDYVQIQSTTPGTAQSGHANVSGTMRAGQFAGAGGGLTGLNASNLTTGTVPMARIPNPFVMSGADPNGLMRLTASSTGFSGPTLRSSSFVPSGDIGIAAIFTSNSNAAYGVYIENLDTSGAGSGLSALAQAPNGTAVAGNHSSSSGSGRGGLFTSNSSSGLGLEASANSLSGPTVGILGRAVSPDGIAIQGLNVAATGNTRGGVFRVNSPNGWAVYGQAQANSGPSYGVYGNSLSPGGAGVRGDNEAGGTGGAFVSNNVGVEAQSFGIAGRGVFARAFGADSSAIRAEAAGLGTSYGGYFLSNASSGATIFSQNLAATGLGTAGEFITQSPNGRALVARATSSAAGNATALVASSAAAGGIAIEANTFGTSGATRALRATSASPGSQTIEITNTGATGFADGLTSVVASPTAAGVFARNSATSGTGNALLGTVASPNGAAIYGEAIVAGGVPYGVFGAGNATGWGLFANGRSGASGTKSFRIDHPQDPENKYLLHYSAEGPEPLNVYSGTAVTDKDGNAWVQLPGYFADINRDPRVQLTVDDDSDDLVVAKVRGGVQPTGFRIRTNKANVKVYWEVKAVRNDAYVQKYGAPVEVEKLAHERGRYQHPELYGAPAERKIGYTGRPVAQNARPQKP